MSLTPWPIALDPSIRTCPAVMYALMSVRRIRAPFPYEPVRHSVLARLPEAPLGHRFPLPAASAGGTAAARSATAAHAPTKATRARCLDKDRAHQQAMGVALDAGGPGPGAGDQRERGHPAGGEQRGDPGVGQGDAPAGHPEAQPAPVPSLDHDGVADSQLAQARKDG